MTVTQNRQLLADRVRDQLLAKILHGSLSVGSQLPPEDELGREFGVSRATIREAVRGLVENGYLSRVHGSGTYVAFRPGLKHSLERNMSYTRLIELAGFAAGRTVLAINRRPPTEDERTSLGLDPNAVVVDVERIRMADSRPVIYSHDVIPSSFLAEVNDSALSGSLYQLFESLGHRVGHGEATLEPTLAGAFESAALHVDEGVPLMFIEQVDYTENGDPVMLSREWHVTGVFQLAVLRRAT